MTKTRARNTLIGQIEQAKEKRSLLPVGKTIRAVIWQRLAPMLPDDIDRLYLWQIGALLNTHMVEPDATQVAKADRIMADRVARVEQFQAKRKERQKGKPKRKR